MKIKNRILISTTLMVLLSLTALLGVGWGLLHMFEKEYLDIASNRALMEAHIFDVEAILNDPGNHTSDWSKLSDSLAQYDYQLYVLQNENIIYSNLEQEQNEVLLEQQVIIPFSPEHTSLLSWDGNTIVGKIASLDNNTYTLVALNKADQTEWFGAGQSQFEIFLKAFLLIGSASILVLLLISQLFSGLLVKKIMLPMEKIIQGSKRIEEGNLSIPIDYQGDQEFEWVCNTFNQMQQHLKEEKLKNEIYEKTRTDMVSGISHDLRTPLTSVKGYLKGLQDGVANTPEKQQQYLAIAYKKACDMEVLLNRLFYFSKLETGNLPFFIVDTDLGDFIMNFVIASREDLAQKKVKILMKKSSGSHPVQIDIEQMNRVLVNLVENALKYAGVEELKLSLSVNQKNGVERLCFSDNGRGVASDKLPHLFEQFYQGDESRSNRNGDGNGLGLYIVKYIVNAHRGDVIAENEGGLKITIDLPQRKEEIM